MEPQDSFNLIYMYLLKFSIFDTEITTITVTLTGLDSFNSSVENRIEKEKDNKQ